MEKIKLNNQVVLMRKYVKQAKVHFINKLVKEVKLLHHRKGDEVQILKATRKAQRFLEKISLLKKIKPDYVSKLALSKAKDWKDILEQKNCTLDDQCIAMLANYGPVQKEVEVFHKSNKDLASKISDLIKQWEEKNKFGKGLSRKKSSDIGKMNKVKSMQEVEVKADGSLLGDAANEGLTDNRYHEFVGKNKKPENSMSADDDHELKGKKQKHKGSDQQKDVLKSTLSTEKLSEEVSCIDGAEENSVKIEESVGEKEKESKNDNCDINEESLSRNYESDSVEENMSKNDDSDDDEENVSKNEDDDESKNNSESEGSTERKHEAKYSKVKDNGAQQVSEFIRDCSFEKKSSTKTVSNTESLSSPGTLTKKIGSIKHRLGEDKLKAITMLNLDDLEGLDEIPVNSAVGNYESSEEEEETDEAERNDISEGKRNDPFFLGCDEVDSVENKCIGNPKNWPFASINKNPSISNYGSAPQREKNKFFDRGEKSNVQSNYKRNFHKPLNSSRSSRDSSEFKNERNNFKKDNFKPKDYQNKFQHKNKNSFNSKNSNRFQPYSQKNFGRDNSRNQREFKVKGKTYTQNYEENKHDNNSNDLYHRKRVNNSFEKSKGPHKKDDTSNKPLHPSWEAKRRQKELTNTSFQGKRVVFND